MDTSGIPPGVLQKLRELEEELDEGKCMTPDDRLRLTSRSYFIIYVYIYKNFGIV